MEEVSELYNKIYKRMNIKDLPPKIHIKDFNENQIYFQTKKLTEFIIKDSEEYVNKNVEEEDVESEESMCAKDTLMLLDESCDDSLSNSNDIDSSYVNT